MCIKTSASEKLNRNMAFRQESSSSFYNYDLLLQNAVVLTSKRKGVLNLGGQTINIQNTIAGIASDTPILTMSDTDCCLNLRLWKLFGYEPNLFRHPTNKVGLVMDLKRQGCNIVYPNYFRDVFTALQFDSGYKPNLALLPSSFLKSQIEEICLEMPGNFILRTQFPNLVLNEESTMEYLNRHCFLDDNTGRKAKHQSEFLEARLYLRSSAKGVTVDNDYVLNDINRIINERTAPNEKLYGVFNGNSLSFVHVKNLEGVTGISQSPISIWQQVTVLRFPPTYIQDFTNFVFMTPLERSNHYLELKNKKPRGKAVEPLSEQDYSDSIDRFLQDGYFTQKEYDRSTRNKAQYKRLLDRVKQKEGLPFSRTRLVVPTTFLVKRDPNTNLYIPGLVDQAVAVNFYTDDIYPPDKLYHLDGINTQIPFP